MSKYLTGAIHTLWHLTSIAFPCFVSSQPGNVGIGTNSPGSSLSVNGSFAASYKIITSSTYSMTSADYYLAWTGIGDGTILLPAAQAVGAGNFQGRVYHIKNTSISRTLSVSANGSELIENQIGSGVSTFNLPPGCYVMLVSRGATSGTTWDVAILTDSKANCTPQYILAYVANDQTGVSVPVNAKFKTIVSTNNIALDTTNGSFTLMAGNTYELEGSTFLFNFSNTSESVNFVWVDASNNVQLPTTTSSISELHPTGYSLQPTAKSIITPTANLTVALRAVISTAPLTFSIRANATFAMIKQLNSCGNSFSASRLPSAPKIYLFSSAITTGEQTITALNGATTQTEIIYPEGTNINTENVLNANIGRFTAPEQGYYQFFGSTQFDNHNVISTPSFMYVKLCLIKNFASTPSIISQILSYPNSAVATATTSAIVFLNTSETVSLTAAAQVSTGLTFKISSSTFYGYKISN